MSTCGCIDCLKEYKACECSLDGMCEGCRETLEYQKDLEFEYYKAIGRI